MKHLSLLAVACAFALVMTSAASARQMQVPSPDEVKAHKHCVGTDGEAAAAGKNGCSARSSSTIGAAPAPEKPAVGSAGHRRHPRPSSPAHEGDSHQ